jgi:pyruvate dehydrogenase E2 component (dihydrolipoamide acetyltransferase)
MATEPLVLPRLGETMEQGRIGRWLKKPGDTFKRGEVLLELESDKTTVELPALTEGRLIEILVPDGVEAKVGAPIATIETAGAARAAPAAAGPAAAAPAHGAAAPAVPVAPAAAAPAGGPALPQRATPSARKLAAQEGVQLSQVTGTGRRGRIERADVQAFAARRAQGGASPAAAPAGLLPWPKVDFARFGPVRREPLSRIRRVAGANLARNWVMIPHVTQHDEADITDLEAFRAELNAEQKPGGAKVTMLAFLMKACANALQQFPDVNASLEGEELVLKDYYHLGFAADTPNGLVVPVVRDVDRKGVLQLARELSGLAARARDGRLAPDDMQGGTFSISSLGGIGGTSFTPIINAPEVAILGVSRSTRKPVWQDDGFEPRLMLPLSLSYDHRVVDGALAARFTTYLSRLLRDFRRVVI